MILKISTNKARYDKGQIFPFLIAIIVVIIIIAMITVNLGQIGVFRTDVSNAADAGALAAVSTLSSYLLGFGLTSDTMFGEAVVYIVAIIIELCCEEYVIAICTIIAYLVTEYVTYSEACGDSEMAWGNAKKNAMQYAFQNAGIDEPRPTFKQFLKGVYDISNPDRLSSHKIEDYNEVYSRGDDPHASKEKRKDIRKFTQSGFSSFMEEGEYWSTGKWGKIEPWVYSPLKITAGYGWTVDNKGNVTSDYDYDYGNDYKKHDNWVKVVVKGDSFYPLGMYNMLSAMLDFLDDVLDENGNYVLEWIEWVFGSGLPAGLEMVPTIQSATDKKFISVSVTRFKKNNNLGLWNFRYGKIGAEAKAHTFGEDDHDGVKHDIEPILADFVLMCFGWYGPIIRDVCAGGGWHWSWFDTKKHLFETELTHTE